MEIEVEGVATILLAVLLVLVGGVEGSSTSDELVGELWLVVGLLEVLVVLALVGVCGDSES